MKHATVEFEALAFPDEIPGTILRRLWIAAYKANVFRRRLMSPAPATKGH